MPDSIIENSLSALGTATAPAAGSAIASIAAVNITPGVYRLDLYFQLSGTAETAVNNLQLNLNGANFTQAPSAGTNTTLQRFTVPRVYLNGTSAARVQAAANATAGSVYTVTLIATRLV
jgi:hypothetical protein